MTGPSTSSAISPDSQLPWADEGAWPVVEGIHRIPLPLPDDGLRAVNVYVIESDRGLTLIDGGWALSEARAVLVRSLASIGHRLEDIHQFLVTHIHRDHFTMASVLAAEYGAAVLLGEGERAALDFIRDPSEPIRPHFAVQLTSAGADHLAGKWPPGPQRAPDLDQWLPPTQWLSGDVTLYAGSRPLTAVHTPGHTPGHYAFVDYGASVLFAGDHVLPTITPSIGFTAPMVNDSLSTFMSSLARVRALPDLRLLPAHGPVTESSHARADELLSFHERRLSASLDGVHDSGTTAFEVARSLGWTRHAKSLDDLAMFEQGLAVLETRAHLEVLVARGALQCDEQQGVRLYSRVAPPGVQASHAGLGLR